MKHMQLVALPDATEARLTGVPPGALVGMALGLSRGQVPVPGGAELDIVPISMSPSVIADGRGHALLRVRYPSGSSAGLKFLSQAVVHDPRKRIGTPGSVVTMPVLQGVVPDVGDEADLVVFFGQSNCEGWASVDDLPENMRGPLPNLRLWNASQGAWQPVEAGVNTNSTPNAPFFGAEIGMAHTIASRPRPLWVVKVARSPSTLGHNPGPGNEWGANAQELYGTMMARIEAAAQALCQLGLSPRVRLICMMQGESDAFWPGLSQAYGENLRELFLQLRADLLSLDLAKPDLPSIRIGLINAHLVRVGILGTLSVRAAQSSLPDQLPNCDTVETSSFELLSDRIHFATSGLLHMGRRFLASGW